jgi:PBSX family phage terminase large subunit
LTERHGLRGLRVILGATRANIERNILQPLRDIYGDQVATSINSQNNARILGEKVYCIGADNIRQVAKIRGSEIAYCAIDEATDVNQEVFEMLKSRLSLPWSCCDITTNPASPNHWFKEFLDSADGGVDIYCQNYTIYDNPFLPPEYVRSLEVEYAGTVWYDRYILGKWTQAEGLIYPMFTQALEEPFFGLCDEYALSVDYGTQNPFAALLWGRKGTVWHVVREYRYSGRETGRQKTDMDYVRDMEDFVDDLPDSVFLAGGIMFIVDPSATSFIAALRRDAKPKEVRSTHSPTGKQSCQRFRVIHANNDVIDGIRDVASCLQNGTIKIGNHCVETIKEFGGYVWDNTQDDKPVKENDHMMDALRYFVKTKRLVVPYKEYISPFMGRS